jgi:selenocysteine-specific elongation factor
MIVGTAGHIDHGKTTLVRALTGVDTDRLPEEKARGISIELGYAFMPASAGEQAERIGFIDVPGHERLVHTMIAGATGIDFGLLLVAADDGVMPQTREHLAVLALLGVPRGAIAITKADRVDDARLAQVRAEVDALVAPTPFARSPVLSVSAHTGAGVDALRSLLVDASLERASAEASERAGPDTAPAAFRLAIDRVFTLAGIGTVVTGTIHAGRVSVGDELALVPSAGVRLARVRSLHAQNHAVDEARAGQRCAISLVGIAKDEIARGQWVVEPTVALHTGRLDALLALWPDEPRPLRSGTPVHVHIGAAATIGSVAVLGTEASTAGSPDDPAVADSTLRPGRSAFVQIVLHEPIAAWRGDRVILRDASASRTIAGGVVLDPVAPSRYRRTPQRLAELAAMSLPTAARRLHALADSAPHGVSLTSWSRSEGRTAQVSLPTPPDALLASDAAHGQWALGTTQARAIGELALQQLRAFHARDPELLGPDTARLRRLVSPRLPEALWKALLAQSQRDGAVTLRGAFVHLPEHALRLSAADERLAQKVAPMLAADGFEGHWVRDLARDAHESELMVRGTLARLAQRGELHQVVKDLYYAPATIAKAAALVRAAAGDTGAITAAGFRDATGLGRKRAIQILEYLDRVGLLRRVGDEHRLRTGSAMFSEENE